MLNVAHVSQMYEGQPVLRDINLHIPAGEILCLLGPSGCGKTTLLRIIAGLERSYEGDVQVDGAGLRGVPVHQRGFGLMFQDLALFPHLDVAGNIAFGLRMAGMPKDEQQRRIREVLELVGLTGFERRDVARLSGGERQRVALARSLAPNPRFLMLDEPLGALDAALREELIPELRGIIKRMGLTALYVTHDQHEAFVMGDRVAVMHDGAVEQVGTPEALYRRPETVFVARFLGLNNVLPVLKWHAGSGQTVFGAFPLAQPAEALLLHPDGVRETDAIEAAIEGRVERVAFWGDAYRVELRHSSGEVLTFKLPSAGRTRPEVGAVLWVHVAPEQVIGLRNTIAMPPQS
ncbi:MAG: ABC transporter ATP-binding protein [Anaerolineae bacterium]|nr:ABC transporter ATP-binding protein [Anaerolineae bacterium]